MAQYDIVFIKNDSVSGVSYSEHKLAKPPVLGFSLTQNPLSGLLSWVQSMNLISTIAGEFDFNDLTSTGYYFIESTASPLNASSSPKYTTGILQVFKQGNFISQVFHCLPGGSLNVNPHLWVRVYNTNHSSWTTWGVLESNYTPLNRPVEDTRSNFSEGTDSIATALSKVEEALMDHTFNHIIEDEVNIRSGDWMLMPDDTFTQNVSYTGLTSDSIIDVSPIIASTSIAQEAEILPFILTGTDNFKVTARNLPTDDIGCIIRIYKK